MFWRFTAIRSVASLDLIHRLPPTATTPQPQFLVPHIKPSFSNTPHTSSYYSAHNFHINYLLYWLKVVPWAPKRQPLAARLYHHQPFALESANDGATMMRSLMARTKTRYPLHHRKRRVKAKSKQAIMPAFKAKRRDCDGMHSFHTCLYSSSKISRLNQIGRAHV